MTDALFLLDRDEPLPGIGTRFELRGPEGRHAATVKRTRLGESVIIADGAGAAVRGPVTGVGKNMITVEVAEQLGSPDPAVRITVAQALAKGDRSELAVEMLTEVGVAEIWPWQSERAIVRWSGERAERGLAKWRNAAREATKQCRRFRVPSVPAAVGTPALAERLRQFDLALVLHEDARTPLRDLHVPTSGRVLIVVGPEGGISSGELDRLQAGGGQLVSVSDGVLRTSTAGVVAVAGVLLR